MGQDSNLRCFFVTDLQSAALAARHSHPWGDQGPETRITAIPPTPGAVDIAQIVLIPSIKPLLIHTLENPVRFLPHNVGRLASSYPDESNGIYPLPQGVREDESRLIYYLR